jgi:hypothetical protein
MAVKVSLVGSAQCPYEARATCSGVGFWWFYIIKVHVNSFYTTVIFISFLPDGRELRTEELHPLRSLPCIVEMLN